MPPMDDMPQPKTIDQIRQEHGRLFEQIGSLWDQQPDRAESMMAEIDKAIGKVTEQLKAPEQKHASEQIPEPEVGSETEEAIDAAIPPPVTDSPVQQQHAEGEQAAPDPRQAVDDGLEEWLQRRKARWEQEREQPAPPSYDVEEDPGHFEPHDSQRQMDSFATEISSNYEHMMEMFSTLADIVGEHSRGISSLHADIMRRRF